MVDGGELGIDPSWSDCGAAGGWTVAGAPGGPSSPDWGCGGAACCCPPRLSKACLFLGFMRAVWHGGLDIYGVTPLIAERTVEIRYQGGGRRRENKGPGTEGRKAEGRPKSCTGRGLVLLTNFVRLIFQSQLRSSLRPTNDGLDRCPPSLIYIGRGGGFLEKEQRGRKTTKPRMLRT